MDDLVAFVKARLDEEEPTARAAAAAAYGSKWHASDGGLYNDDPSHHPGAVLSDAYEYNDPALFGHIARWDPARVLREVEAKRRILEEAERIWNSDADGIFGSGMEIAKMLALPYSEHVNYHDEWRP